MELFLLVAAVVAAIGGATYARLVRARADLARAIADTKRLPKVIRGQLGRLILVAAGLSALLWIIVQGGNQ